MREYIKTNSEHPDFLAMNTALDAELRIRDGAEHAFYSQYNKIDKIKHVIIAMDEGKPVGCGALKPYGDDVVEIKRMFVREPHRGQGIASYVLSALEEWAKELKYDKCILETGVNQPEAIALYHKSKYTVIPNYGQYLNADNSVCFEKELG